MAKKTGDKTSRAQVVEQMRAEQRRREVRTKLTWIVGGVVLVLIVAAGIGYVVSKRSASGPTIQGVKTYTGLSQKHVATPVTYPQSPPVGGEHNPTPLTCGIYTSPVPNENAVHSMEHGAVWVTYQPGLSAADVKTLQDATRGKAYVILSPYQGLSTPVVASAWGRQLKLTGVSDPRLAEFVSTYAAGPQTPEPGAPCTGTGTPVQ